MEPPDSLTPRCRFATTRWSLVQAAVGESDEADAALAELCATYWFPVYAHLRQRCPRPEEAGDLTQDFFLNLLEKGTLRDVDCSRGRFRSFLLAAVNHFASNQWDRQQAQKRGGGIARISLDLLQAEHRYQVEARSSLSPEAAFERRWALALLEKVHDELAAEYAEPPERQRLFQALRPCLPMGRHGVSYARLAEELAMSEAAVKVAVYRLRQRFGTLARREIAQTVATADEVDSEIQRLFAALRPGD